MASEFKSLKGQLLLDGGLLQGSFFHRTVVLVCQHDAEGALGLVLNKPTHQTVGEALDAQIPDRLKEKSLYMGGPVQPSVMSYLHSDTYVPHANVLPNLNLGHSLDSLVELGESYSTTQQIRVFAGYAGWSAGQLDEEMKRKAWVTHPADLELVFETDHAGLWRKILKSKGWRCQLLAEAPEDITWN